MNDPYQTNRVFVGGISWKATEESLANFFSSYGKVVECKIIMDKVTGKSKGYGFVTFESSDVAQKVKQSTNLYFLGKMMNVGDAVRKSDGSKMQQGQSYQQPYSQTYDPGFQFYNQGFIPQQFVNPSGMGYLGYPGQPPYAFPGAPFDQQGMGQFGPGPVAWQPIHPPGYQQQQIPPQGYPQMVQQSPPQTQPNAYAYTNGNGQAQPQNQQPPQQPQQQQPQPQQTPQQPQQPQQPAQAQQKK